MEERHDSECNVWVGCQQCDGPDLTRTCTCIEHALIDKKLNQLRKEKQQINNNV